MNTLPLVLLVSLAVGGIAWVFLYPVLSGEKAAEKRKQNVVRTGASMPARSIRGAQKPRREQIESSLKELEARLARLPDAAGEAIAILDLVKTAEVRADIAPAQIRTLLWWRAARPSPKPGEALAVLRDRLAIAAEEA